MATHKNQSKGVDWYSGPSGADCAGKMVMMNFGKMKWVYKTKKRDEDEGLTAICISEVGDPKHPASPRIDAQRINSEVIINGIRGIHIIPADTVVRGFGEKKDGKTLRELMVPNVLYNYFLEPVA